MRYRSKDKKYNKLESLAFMSKLIEPNFICFDTNGKEKMMNVRIDFFFSNLPPLCVLGKLIWSMHFPDSEDLLITALIQEEALSTFQGYGH